MPQPSFLPSKLEARTIGLVHLGVNAHAWKEDDAYEVVRQCRELLVPILGGDVLKLDSVTKEIKYTYDNWYVEGGLWIPLGIMLRIELHSIQMS
jgi:hypothetical protein